MREKKYLIKSDWSKKKTSPLIKVNEIQYNTQGLLFLLEESIMLDSSISGMPWIRNWFTEEDYIRSKSCFAFSMFLICGQNFRLVLL